MKRFVFAQGDMQDVAGVLVCLVLLALGFLLSMHRLQHALLVYLACWLFALAVALGSVSLLLIHVLTGGEWGERLHPQLLVAAGIFPYVAVAVLPLLLGMHSVFPWLRPGIAMADPDIARQHWYLNAAGVAIRTLACVAWWGWLVHALTRRTRTGMRPATAAIGLILMLVTVTLLATDWVMSLVPAWHSTDIGLLLFSSQLLIAFALAVLWPSIAPFGASSTSQSQLRRDYGSLMLAMVLGWAYVSYMDYLTAWIADQPAETAWYLPRVATGWRYAAIVLAVLGLAVPFFSLLSARAKSSRRVLAVVAVVTLIAQAVNTVWLILPSVVAQGADLSWGDPFLCAGLLGMCAIRYRTLLRAEVQVS
jgi:hypothetical protein